MYSLDFSAQGKAHLVALDKPTAQRVLDKLKWLVGNIDDINHLALKGNLAGLYKLRIGDWRVLYEIDAGQKVLTVHRIGHRKTVYNI